MIELIDVHKQFEAGGRWISNGVNLSIEKGTSTCIIGASGEGKSVLLKQMMGLIPSTSGSIKIDGTDITGLDHNEMEDVYKKCGYVFQFAALLDSLTIYENIGITLLEKGVPEKIVQKAVFDALEKVNLNPDIINKYPAEISGGMKKRVGLARTLITEPLIILYDEPTTGLDPITTTVVHELMYNTHKKFGITSVVVSHDIGIFDYVDNIAFLYKGKIEFFGEAKTIWESTDPYVYQFIRGLTKGPLS